MQGFEGGLLVLQVCRALPMLIAMEVGWILPAILAANVGRLGSTSAQSLRLQLWFEVGCNLQFPNAFIQSRWSPLDIY